MTETKPHKTGGPPERKQRLSFTMNEVEIILAALNHYHVRKNKEFLKAYDAGLNNSAKEHRAEVLQAKGLLDRFADLEFLEPLKETPNAN